MNVGTPLARVDLGQGLTPATLQPIAWHDPKIKFATDRCRSKRVFDIGCVMHDLRAFNNPFFLHRALKEVAASLVGIDLHAEGVAAMRARGYDVRVGNAEGFDLGEQFDVIVAGDIIEHIANLDGFLRSVDAALAPGGMLLVMTPNPWWWKFVVKAALRPEVGANPEHTCWFCPQTWRQLVERYGFTLGQVQHHSRYRRDAWLPLPLRLRSTSWAAETVRVR